MRRRLFLVGSAWSLLNSVANVMAPLLFFIYFARLAPVEQVGLVGFALAVLECLKTLAPAGLYEAALGEPELDPAFMGGFLSLLLLAGLLVFVVYAAVVLFMATERANVAMIAAPLVALGAKAVFDLAAVQPQAELARRSEMHRMGLRGLVTNLVGGAAGLLVAQIAAPIDAIVTYYVAQAAAGLLVCVVGARSLARPRLRLAGTRRLYRQGAMASLVTFLGSINSYFDQAFISAFVPLADVARYNLAKRVEILLFSVSQTFGGILFQPLFARQDDPRPGFRRALAMMFLLGGGVTVFAIANARDLVTLVFGERWASTAPALGFFAISGFARMIGAVHGAYFSVSRRNADLLKRSLFSSAAGVLVIALVGPMGISWCAFAIAGKNIVATGWSAIVTRDLAGARFYVVHLGVLTAAMACGAVLGPWLCESVLPAGGPGRIAALAISLTGMGLACLAVLGSRLRLALRGDFAGAGRF